MKHLIAAATLALMADAGLAQQMPDTADPERGQPLYAENCASCHGADLEGQPDWRRPNDDGTLPAPPHDETGHSWHHGDGLLFTYTLLGGQAALEASGIGGFKSGMPAFGETLSETEIWDILAYIRSTWPRRVQEMQAVRSESERMRDN